VQLQARARHGRARRGRSWSRYIAHHSSATGASGCSRGRSRRNEQRCCLERGSTSSRLSSAGVIRYESPSIERLLGYRPEDSIGLLASRYVHAEDLPAVTAAFTRAVGGRTTSVECRALRRDGSWCDVEAAFTNLLDHPAVGGVVVNWRDISERKRAEAERGRYIRELARARDQALASTRAKSMFLANMSHEIRTPLNVIVGMTDMVCDTELTAEQRENLDRSRAATLGLLAVINDILDVSKIEAGKMTIEVVDMDLRRTIEESAGLLAPAATGKGLRWLRFSGPERVRRSVRVRPSSIWSATRSKFARRGGDHRGRVLRRRPRTSWFG
jgi:PAS domain S-box-containing protein